MDPPMDAPSPSPLLLNRAQADRVLGRHGLDGLVAAQPINVYYLSSYWGVLMGVGRDPLYFAVLPRNDAEPAALVMGSFEMRRLVAEGGTWMPNLVGYTAPLDADHATEGAAPYAGWPVRAGAALSANEHAGLALQDRLRGSESASSLLAIAKAVREAGLERATLGIDDLRLEGWLRAAGLEHATFVPAEHVFCEIRRVKSPAEIELLRTAARINEIACLEAAAQLHDGAEWSDVENHYMAELALRGGRGCYLSGGSGGLPHLRVRRGEPTMIDALGRYRQYVGDFGRTVVVGDPSADLLRRNAAMQRGWLEVYDTVRPGLRYRDLAERCVAAIRRNGFPEFMVAVPHSIGLQHTDDPAPLTLAGPDYGDPVLEPGIVFNVDLPYIEIGWGAVHLEDTLLVTDDGCEPLTSMQMDLLAAP